MRKILVMLFIVTAIFSCKEDEIEYFKGTNMVNIFNEYYSTYSEKMIERGYYSPFDEDDLTMAEDTSTVIVYCVNDDQSKDRVIKFKYEGDYSKDSQSKLPVSITIPAGEMSARCDVITINIIPTDPKVENIIRMTVDESSGYIQGADGSMEIRLLQAE